MSFFIIGKDYQNSPLVEREELFLRKPEVKESFFPAPVAILSTCNRFEVYGAGEPPFRLHPLLKGAKLIRGRKDVFRHALRVACGLESQLKGETQILEQIYNWKGNLENPLLGLWEDVYQEAEGIRRDTGLCQDDYNIASFLYKDIGRHISCRRPMRIVVIGTGKIACALAKNKPVQAQLYFAAHKNKERAGELAQYSQGVAVSFDGLIPVIREADILISATASPHLILTREKLAHCTLGRDRPLYVYDLAVPRDIDPLAGEINGLVLKDLGGLSSLFREHNAEIKQKLSAAEYLVEERVEAYESGIDGRKPSEPLSYKAG